VRIAPRSPLAWSLLAVTALAAVFLAAPIGSRYQVDLATFLPLHSFLEAVAIVLCALIFGVVWNAYSLRQSGNVVILACAFLAAALIEFAHMLSYPGMPDFVTPASADKSIFLWLAARFVSAAALLVVALRPPDPFRSPRTRQALLVAALGVTALAWWFGLSGEESLPRAFEEETGLTPLKVGAEYGLVALFLTAAALFLREAYRTASAQAVLFFGAAAMSALSEIALTRYATLTDFDSLLGHVYKVIACAFIYRAVFVASVREPFEWLKARERALARAERIAHVGSWDLDLRGDRLVLSEEALRIHGVGPEALDGGPQRVIGLAHPEDRARVASALHGTLHEGRPFAIDYRIVRPDGEVRHVRAEDEVVQDAAGLPLRAFGITQDVTERKLAEVALKESEDRYRSLVETMAEGAVMLGEDGRCLACNTAAARILGLAEDQILGRTSHELGTDMIRDDGTPYAFDDTPAMRALRSGQPESDRVIGLRRPGGAVQWIRGSSRPLFRPGSTLPYAVVWTFHDITERRRAEERIRRLNRVYAVLSAINETIIRTENRQELFEEACRIAVELGGFRFAWVGAVDAQAERLVPLASAGDGGAFLDRVRERLSLRDAAPRGHGIAALAVREVRAVFVNDVEADPRIVEKSVHLDRGVHSAGVLPIVLDGKPVAVLGLHAPDAGFFDGEEQRLLQELAGDIAFALDHIEKAEKIRYLAYYDQLTGLANRELLLERLAQQLGAAAHDGRKAALVIIRIDRFKTINDAHGRQAGDALLRQVGARLVELTGDAGNVARVGADQFAVLVPVVRREENLVRRLEEGNRVVDGSPYRVNGVELRISTSAGIALYPEDGTDAETLFRNAEAALKNTDTADRYLFYTAKMTERVAERLQLENRLRLAVERREFLLHYQPKVDACTGKRTSVEALIRWADPHAGLVAPGEFIPLLEETGLILPVGEWALREAVRQHRAWSAEGLSAPRIAVNVSALQLRGKDFVSVLREVIGAPPGGAHGLDIEITESLIMSNVEENIEKLAAARQMGLRVFIDDFGTGYSSLRYIARLPLDALKIDRSFVVSMTNSAQDMAIVSSILALGRDLRLKVVAEGVESEEQAKILRLLKCDELQGFLFAKPLPADAVAALLAGQGGASAATAH